jgi:hypothetical protein
MTTVRHDLATVPAITTGQSLQPCLSGVSVKTCLSAGFLPNKYLRKAIAMTRRDAFYNACAAGYLRGARLVAEQVPSSPPKAPREPGTRQPPWI